MDSEIRHSWMTALFQRIRNLLKQIYSVDQVYLFIIVLLFLCFSYYNIFQQTQLQVQLPYVDVVKLLRNGRPQAQSVNGNASAFSDLYNTVSNHFESTYKDAYLAHYSDYGVLLIPVLTFSKRYIGLIYIMKSVQSRNGVETSVLDKAVFQTAKTFMKTPDIWTSLYGVNPVPGSLNFKNTKSAYKQFLYTCIYPMYKAGRPELEPGLFNLDQTLTGYKVMEWIQVMTFILALLLEVEIILPSFYRKSFLSKLMSITYIIMLTLVGSCACLSVTFVVCKRSPVYGTFNSILDFFQMVFMLLIGCFMKRFCLWMNTSNLIPLADEHNDEIPTSTASGCKAPPVSTAHGTESSKLDSSNSGNKCNMLSLSGLYTPTISATEGTVVTNDAQKRKANQDMYKDEKRRRGLVIRQSVYEKAEANPGLFNKIDDDDDDGSNNDDNSNGDDADDELDEQTLDENTLDALLDNQELSVENTVSPPNGKYLNMSLSMD